MNNIKFKGKVIKGLEVGAKFGIATANIEIKEPLPALEEGVYFVRVAFQENYETFIQKKVCNGILHFGHLETFGRGLTCEVHLLDFDQDLYGKDLEVEVLDFLRLTQNFQNADLLYTQIEKDIVMAEKYFLRKKACQNWNKISEAEKVAFSDKAFKEIQKLPIFLEAKRVFIYAPQRKCEIDFTEELMKKFPKKSYFFPKITKEREMKFFPVKQYAELEPGEYGILEPKDTQKGEIRADILFLPAVAADREGNRLGRGKGFYDWFLAKVKAPTVCVLPGFSIYEKIPVQKHDKKADKVIEI